jgi:hypothetical protein
MSHHLLHHESSLRCIEAQGTGQTMTDPIRQPLQRLPNPLALLEGSSGDLLSRDELPPAAVEVVLGDRSLESLQSLPAFSD